MTIENGDSTTVVVTPSVTTANSFTSQCILCREVCMTKTQLIQHLRNHLIMEDNKIHIVNSNNTSNGNLDNNSTTLSIPANLVDLLKTDSNKELCA